MIAAGWRPAMAAAKAGDFGIIGDPVQHSLSPSMQNPALERWWRHHGRSQAAPPRYHLFPVPAVDVTESLNLFREKELAGLNVTVPYKTAVVPLLDRLEPFAQSVGAVNTIKREDGKAVGYNTDGAGFARALGEDMHFAPTSALILGAGGTGQVIVHQLLALDVDKIYWWNRSADRVAALIEQLPAGKRRFVRRLSTEKLRAACAEVDLIVNATSVGLHATDGLPAPSLEFGDRQVAFDVVYHRETAFLQEAKKSGARVCGGLPMLLHQGTAAFEIWTGEPAPVDLMKDALIQSVKAKGIVPVWPSDI